MKADVSESPPPGHPHGHRHAHALDEHGLPQHLTRPSTPAVIGVVLVFLALLAGLFVLGEAPRQRAAEQADAAADAQADGVPVVQVNHPAPEANPGDIILPCDVRANQQTAIFPRANGYLKQWMFDVGAHVKKGQLLAVIATPDVDAQRTEAQAAVQEAKAMVIKAQADVEEAQTDYNRYLMAAKENPGSVTQEDIDTKQNTYADAVGTLDVAKATVAQDAAEVQRLTVLQGFERVTAPFSGVITARHYDVGALMNPGSTAAGTELFDIADIRTLRVYVDVPQFQATEIAMGQPAYLSVRNYPHREFKGVVARMTGALNQSTRTLTFELDFPNPDGALYPGMYGEARLPPAKGPPTLVIPSSALIFNAGGVQAALVRDGKVHFQKITVGRDLGTELEVLNGLSAEDEVIADPSQQLAEGMAVKTAPDDATAER
jgi:membrane fusion protein, multidrug efflux system